MSSDSRPYDLIVLGAGPAGQKAAVQGAKAGRRVLLVEREKGVGGECVRRGTIPSKALRQSAAQLAALRDRDAEWMQLEVPGNTSVQSLMRHLEDVLQQHESYMGRQITGCGVELVQGHARFLSPTELEVEVPRAGKRRFQGEVIVIATGSRPRLPPDVPVDHETVLDSDSILSQIYLPKSLTVLGAGIIACEFASIFQALGTRVTIVDKAPRPLAFLDEDLCRAYVRAFEAAGGEFLPGRAAAQIEVDELKGVVTRLDDGRILQSEKMLCAQGRMANLGGLNLAAIGLAPNKRGYLEVDKNCRTSVGSVYAVGDVIGPPALATSAMEQGRRAVMHAFGLGEPPALDTIPVGVYTIPELACLGLTEAQAREQHGAITVGTAHFSELARGHINGCTEGFIKLVACPAGKQLLGAHIAGEGAAELIHLAQLALVGKLPVDAFVDNIFNFPTLAEGYRVAALAIVEQREGRTRAAPRAA